MDEEEWEEEVEPLTKFDVYAKTNIDGRACKLDN